MHARIQIGNFQADMVVHVDLLTRETSLCTPAEAFLENLAVAARRGTEAAWRNAGSAMEGTHEIRQVGKTDIERDRGD